jgi:hypothetical protein
MEDILKSLRSGTATTDAVDSDESEPVPECILTTIQIRTCDGETFIRSVILGENQVALQTDLEFYYRTLLGFEGCEVIIQKRPVPPTFTLRLIGATANEPPKAFPSHDIRNPADPAKLDRLIESVCEMERMRAELGVGTDAMPMEPKPATDEDFFAGGFRNMMSRTRSKYDEWLTGILQSIQQEMPDDHESMNAIENRKYIAAYVLTPALKEVREARGCRILFNQEIGEYWNDRLGTELFPDLVVSRRLSVFPWRFRGPQSLDLVRATVAWYVAAQKQPDQMGSSSSSSGVSGWIPSADHELVRLIAPFADVGAGAVFRESEDAPGYETATNPLAHLLEMMEKSHVRSAHAHANTFIPTRAQWERYIRVLARTTGLSSEKITTYWGLATTVVARWVREKQGFQISIGAPAPVAEWQDLWEIVWNTASDRIPMKDRFDTLLATLDANNPIIGLTMRLNERGDIVAKWLRLFYERELEFNRTAHIPLPHLCNAIRRWCKKYLNEEVSSQFLKNYKIGAFLTGIGYTIVSSKGVSTVVGLACKNISVLFDDFHSQCVFMATQGVGISIKGPKLVAAKESNRLTDGGTAPAPAPSPAQAKPNDFGFAKKMSDRVDVSTLATVKTTLEAAAVPPKPKERKKYVKVKAVDPFTPVSNPMQPVLPTVSPDIIHLGKV